MKQRKQYNTKRVYDKSRLEDNTSVYIIIYITSKYHIQKVTSTKIGFYLIFVCSNPTHGLYKNILFIAFDNDNCLKIFYSLYKSLLVLKPSFWSKIYEIRFALQKNGRIYQPRGLLHTVATTLSMSWSSVNVPSMSHLGPLQIAVNYRIFIRGTSTTEYCLLLSWEKILMCLAATGSKSTATDVI